jgi:hypothetical protein
VEGKTMDGGNDDNGVNKNLEGEVVCDLLSRENKSKDFVIIAYPI